MKKIIILVICIAFFGFVVKSIGKFVKKEKKDEKKLSVLDMKKEDQISVKIDQSTLPAWDLSDLYKSIDSPEITKDYEKIEREVSKFANDYKGKINKISGKELYGAIKRYEHISELSTKIDYMGMLSRSLDSKNEEVNKFISKNVQKMTDLQNELVFFSIEISKIAEKDLLTMYSKSKELKTYKPFIDDIRRFKDHILSEEVEKVSSLKDITSSHMWIKLYDDILSGLSIKIGEEKFNLESALTKLQSGDRNERRDSFIAISGALKKKSEVITAIINSVIKNRQTEDKIRGYKNPMSSRNLSNDIDDKTVETLISVVRDNYKKTSHRYYKLKARLLNLDKLNYYDRLAPMPFTSSTTYSWEEAKNMVLDSYEAFSPRMSEMVKQFFDKNWIDARTMPNKSGGAFCAGGVVSGHPYILMTFKGTPIDVKTLAHELGHGVHDLLAYHNGQLMYHPPLTLAETASIFGEQVTFRNLLKKTKNNNEKAALIASQIDNMIGSVVRQIAFVEFEKRIHQAGRKAELSSDEINSIWLDISKESLGSYVEMDEHSVYFWEYVQHFFHSPFYVYSYPFGELLVNALYHKYLKGEIDDFESKYMNMLAAGGTKNHAELLKTFDIDVSKASFWQDGMDVLSDMIDDLESLVAEIEKESIKK